MHRRAACIWTSRQRIDHGALARLFFGGPQRRDDGQNRWFLFRRRFALPGPPDAGRLTVTVDGRYQLFVNGVRLGRGPVRADPLHQRTDTHDIAPALRPGDNVVAFLIHVYGIDTSWYQRVRGGWQEFFGDGALYCDASVRCGREIIDVCSDETWRCLESTAWTRDVPRANWGLGFIEAHDARLLPEGWTLPGFDDSGWDPTQILVSGGGPPDGMLGGLTVTPFPVLLPREIPFLEERPVAPMRVLRWAAVTPRPDLPLDRRCWGEPHAPLPTGLVDGPDALLTPDGDATRIRTTAEHDVTVLLDFGRIQAGHPFVDLEATGGEVVEVLVAEGIPGEFDPGFTPTRLAWEGAHGTHLFSYTARPGRQRFERFEWSAVRYAEVTVRNAPAGVRLHHVGATATRYPAAERGAFECSDPFLTRLWAVGRETLRQCMHDAWEDCPGREQRQWLGDVTVEFLVAQAALGPDANALNRQFLLHAAESQRSDGLTQMYAPGDHHHDGMTIPDWTLQWILNAGQHHLYTGDLDTIADVFPAIERALAWFARHLDAHGLVADLPYWHFMDWAALGRHGEAAALNALLAGACREAARLADALEAPRSARRHRAMADRIATAVDARHWDPARGVYVDVVDPATGAREPRVSQHANAACILWDVAPPARWASAIAHVTDPARVVFTAAPPIVPGAERAFDPARDVVLANTFFSHFLYRALCRAGRFDLVLRLVRERYGPMLARGATTLWESFAPTASLCHGFSTSPVFQLSTEVLGVAPLEPGFTRFRVAPQPADLTHARGVFPTIHGDVTVAWERGGAAMRLDLGVPPGTTAAVVAPAGFTLRPEAAVLSAGMHHLDLSRSG